MLFELLRQGIYRPTIQAKYDRDTYTFFFKNDE